MADPEKPADHCKPGHTSLQRPEIHDSGQAPVVFTMDAAAPAVTITIPVHTGSWLDLDRSSMGCVPEGSESEPQLS